LPSLRHQTHQFLTDSRVFRNGYLHARPALAELAPDNHDVVIEGYPRSANTYAVAAFGFANPTARISAHLHSWVSVEHASRLGLPTMVLIREPSDAAASLMVFRPGLTARAALRQYLTFYEHAASHADSVVMTAFEEAIADFGCSIRRLNSRFGTAFQPYAKSRDNEEAVRQAVEQLEMNRAGRVSELTVARPSDERRRLSAQARELIAREERLIGRASDLYRQIILAPMSRTDSNT
jgi:hypothetical protein